ncbi:hypothetical protein DFO50_107149 [Microvirgula sp. AG722]|uniref:hypothetical protein n=1 Tax=Microvirgula sp. AG722 TaxID=2183901 RepID=UPI000DC53565|nr:hypothetical protein [Microvirgula sp. AG722]RAS15611.1 hypothetical protein DFO50_107149 [Microvirgula sp. AG722]
MRDDTLADFLAPGLFPADLPALSDLLGARQVIDALITLFRGGEDEVLVRLLVLREIGARAGAPRWTPQDLQQRFAYLNPTKLDTVLKRLRENGLLLWHADSGDYQLAEHARRVLAALATLVQLDGDDAELGYLAGQVAAGQAMGEVSGEALTHLLARLNELHAEFEEALESQSEFRIRAAQGRLEAVWRWVARGTEVVRAIIRDDTQDLSTLAAAQQVAYAQARMLHLAGTFQRRLAQLAVQRVHLGQSGLTSTDIAGWLRTQSAPALAGLLDGVLSPPPLAAFLSTPELADVAEYELIARERVVAATTGLPPSRATDDAEPQAAERQQEADAFLEALDALPPGRMAPIAGVVLADSYAETAYRMSLLALLGDPEPGDDAGALSRLATAPWALAGGEGLTHPDHPEIASLSDAQLIPFTDR